MKTPLIPIDILSVYTNKFAQAMPLPSRMAKCTPNSYQAIFNIAKELAARGGKLILSDLFRSYDMQAQSHQDYVAGRKKAFSPAPGGSFHEAGRACDFDLSAIKIPLSEFLIIAKKYGFNPIISEANPKTLESWHFDCRGRHQLVYEYYAAKKGTNFKAYTAAAASGILSIDVHVDAFGENQKQAALQSCLIRLGIEIGDIDGVLGKRSHAAIEELGIRFDTLKVDEMLLQAENLIQAKFPREFKLPPGSINKL